MENTFLTNLTRTTSYFETPAFSFQLPENKTFLPTFGNFEINTFKGIDYIESLGDHISFIPNQTYFTLLIETDDGAIVELTFNFNEWLNLHHNLKNLLCTKESFGINKTDMVVDEDYKLIFKWSNKRNLFLFKIKPQGEGLDTSRSSDSIRPEQLEELLNLKFNS